MTWADGVNLHLLCYLTWYLIIQETLQICHILTSFPCTPETWIFRASFSDLSPYIINFQRAKFKDISEKRACRKTDLAVKGTVDPHPPLSPSCPWSSTLPPHPIIKTLLDGFGGMGQQSTRSHNSLWIYPHIYRTVQVLSIYMNRKQQSWKKILFLTTTYSIYLSLNK